MKQLDSAKFVANHWNLMHIHKEALVKASKTRNKYTIKMQKKMQNK